MNIEGGIIVNLNFNRPMEEMSEQELREILDWEWERPDMNVDLLKQISVAFETKTGNVTTVDVQAAWQQFLRLFGQ